MEIVSKGRLFDPKRDQDWLFNYASVPIPVHVKGDIYKVYFGGRNEANKTQIGYAKVDIGERKVIKVSEKPVVGLGKPGRFDDSAVWPSWIVQENSKEYLYYNGWVQGETVPYYSTIGVAIRREGREEFEKYSDGPIIGKSVVDPYITGGSCVLIEEGLWRMWYLSAVDFEILPQGPMYYYHIKYAESENGIDWDATGEVCIDFEHNNETRIARPCVRRTNEGYEMWYSYAIGFDGYSLGYAVSKDGVEWERQDNIISVTKSKKHWDSEMFAYPYVFEHKKREYVMYNGNDYGKTGFGIAKVKRNE